MRGVFALKRFAHSVAEPSDQDLVAQALEGSAAAFSELATRHRARVERLCQRFFADAELVRDLAQEAFIHAYAGLKGYRAEIPFAAWLRAIAVNLCYDELRRRKRRPEELVGDFTAPETNWIGLVNTATPEEIVEAAEERREAKQLAERLLATLKPEDRLVLTLQNGEELSVSEIAEIVGWSEAKVKIRAFRARQALRRQAARLVRQGGAA